MSTDDIPPPTGEGRMVPLTPIEWAMFTPKQQWDVIVALRGPDCKHPEVIKWYGTSVIRGKLRKVMRVGGMINQDLNLIVLPDPLTIASGGLFDGYHFFTHLQEAAEILNIPTAYVGTVEYSSVLSGSYGHAGKHFLTLLKGKKKQELERHLAGLGY